MVGNLLSECEVVVLISRHEFTKNHWLIKLNR
jgi:hypothetical protein